MSQEAGAADPQGLAYDAFAEDYDRGRTGWPPELLDGIDAEAVLDLAAGTGKLTALLAEHYANVAAVEPLAGMRAVLERNVPAARVFSGTAERIPLADASVDAVFVAEAFHWFDSRAAATEVARVLRPGGTLSVSFNHWVSGLSPALPAAVEAELENVWTRLPPPGGPRIDSGAWKLGFAGLPFGPFEEHGFPHEWVTGRDAVAAYFVSTSSMGALPAADRLALRERLVAVLPDVTYRLDLVARVYRTRRS